MKLKKTQAMNYKTLLITVILLPAGLTLAGQQFSDSKTLRKSFRAGSEAILEVTNKYGDIHVTHTGNDSVTVMVEITASSNT
ncbi:MAG TPA: hypothetical protein PLK38_10525, partial [Methanoregulaceae archaeon]|nr:hypothetical protein [Methanoregulaceae archaeon]